LFTVHYRASFCKTLNSLPIYVILLVFELNISPFAGNLMTKLTWVLASQSPRRSLLLTEAGVDFIAIKPPFDDPPHPADTGVTPENVATQLSNQKALSVHNLYPDKPIIAADTLIIMPDGSLAGTPVNREQAHVMIAAMCHHAHWVVTGVTLLLPGEKKPIHLADRAQVTLGDIPDCDLNAYLDTDLWQGKAGGYNLFERQKAGWPITVEGDETTVVGLPMQMLRKAMSDLG
jgi:septum formation protein